MFFEKINQECCHERNIGYQIRMIKITHYDDGTAFLSILGELAADKRRKE